MAVILRAERVDGPAPVARPYGLLQSPAVTIIDEPDERWLNGVTLDRYLLARGDVTGSPCDLSTVAPFDAVRSPGANDGDYAAFGVVMGEECATAGLDSAEFRRRLRASFEASDGAVVESQFMYPADAANPSLAADATTITGGGLGTAFGNLEQEFADNHGSLGVFHISPKLATHLQALTPGFLIASGRGWVTVNGSPVVIGAGYTGIAPIGQSASDATHEYVYMTGPVQARRTDTMIFPGEDYEAVDRETNTFTVYAIRYYALVWDSSAVYASKADMTSL